MGQKVHPLGFRLGITQKHKNFWCEKPKISSLWIQDATFLRNYIEKTFKKAGIINVEIRRRKIAFTSLYIEIYAAYPMVFFESDIKKKNFNWRKSLNKVRMQLINSLKDYYIKRNLPSFGDLDCTLFLKSPDKANSYATVLADKVVDDLQQRKPYRQIMKNIIREARNAGVKGIKIQISGRLNGAEIARSDKLRYGSIPLNTLRADIDYCEKAARTIYGLLGVKIWIFRGDILTSIKNI
uniref:Small ribosomal subunit protein uS3c n=1 Tax=Prototheca cutis TaxID=575411 RepID=A0A2Z6BEQ8_9CHLO|nr:ribosomal protein s3 [Prototheca cutis]BBD20216.1 ribosomal protein s3 [Prototheca cutis]